MDQVSCNHISPHNYWLGQMLGFRSLLCSLSIHTIVYRKHCKGDHQPMLTFLLCALKAHVHGMGVLVSKDAASNRNSVFTNQSRSVTNFSKPGILQCKFCAQQNGIALICQTSVRRPLALRCYANSNCTNRHCDAPIPGKSVCLGIQASPAHWHAALKGYTV